MRLLSASHYVTRILFLATVFAVSFSGCRTTDSGPVPVDTRTAGNNAATSGGTQPQGGTVTALAPTPVSFGGNRPTDSAAPTITAKCAILIDQYGRVLYEKNADQKVPVASTQKLLLGIMISQAGNLQQPVTVADSDTWAEPTKMGIKTGQVYTRQELLHTVLIRSSNDIARALARDHSGSVSSFAAAMNLKARQLGMYNSYFTNASGLPTPPGQYSTARDLSKLGAAALKDPFVRNSIRTNSTVFRFSSGTTKTVYNTNQVLRIFPYCTGAKTGYTNAAGRCLVSSATYGRKSVIAVILGSKTPNVWTESEALLRYGLGL
jgi:D-alanyl-D-alanine carboxypeptidase (penicillin-binding protein 5/6)